MKETAIHSLGGVVQHGIGWDPDDVKGAGPPSSPTNLTARLRPDGLITLNWDAPTAGPAPNSYQVGRSTGRAVYNDLDADPPRSAGRTGWDVRVADDTQSVGVRSVRGAPGLTDGVVIFKTSAWVSVLVADAVSVVAASSSTPCNIPATVQGVGVTVSGTTATVSWTRHDCARGYHVSATPFLRTGSTVFKNVGDGQHPTSHAFTGLVVGRTYDFKVKFATGSWDGADVVRKRIPVPPVAADEPLPGPTFRTARFLRSVLEVEWYGISASPRVTDYQVALASGRLSTLASSWVPDSSRGEYLVVPSRAGRHPGLYHQNRDHALSPGWYTIGIRARRPGETSPYSLRQIELRHPTEAYFQSLLPAVTGLVVEKRGRKPDPRGSRWRVSWTAADVSHPRLRGYRLSLECVTPSCAARVLQPDTVGSTPGKTLLVPYRNHDVTYRLSVYVVDVDGRHGVADVRTFRQPASSVPR